MTWLQMVIKWKKLNINKVSESFNTCRQLCMMTLEEVEIFVVDLVLVDYSIETSTIVGEPSNDETGTKIAMMYNEYIHEIKSKDDRQLYFSGFIIMASKFRNY